ncbi:GIY-YIG nuclease family protein [Fulvivirga sp.]|uniref:GIY-YIG nuclease family protein n=1 Tax=Fulvivirga sp. TaxID=1931237 RepID=UPI0032F06601
MYFVYILYSPKLRKFYKGQTSNLESRLERHNSGYEKYTSNGVPWLLLWSTVKETRSQATILESKLKNLYKERLIKFMIKYEKEIVEKNLAYFKRLSRDAKGHDVDNQT